MATANQIPLHLPRRLDDVQRQIAGPHRNPLNLLMADFAPRDDLMRAQLRLIASPVIKLHSPAQPGPMRWKRDSAAPRGENGRGNEVMTPVFCRLSLVT